MNEAAQTRPRVVIAGFGDTGLLVALHLRKRYQIVGITPKPCLVSGQELGTRLTRPDQWRENYLMDYARYPHLQGVTVIQGLVTAIDPQQQTVTLQNVQGDEQIERYDVLVIASGVRNGFWRTAHIETIDDIQRHLQTTSQALLGARSVAIIGGGPTGVSTASNLKETNPAADVHLFFSQEQPLPGYHPATRRKIQQRLAAQGVHLHPGHRAILPTHGRADSLTRDPVQWHTGQSAFTADQVLWATGQLKPNNAFIPRDMLNEKGFVKADAFLRVPGYANVFTVGDIADTDPLRCSARNAGFLTLAHNIDAVLQQRPHKLKRFKPARYRWGSILGVQNEGMRIFTPNGGDVRVSRPLVKRVLFPLFVHRMIYRGIRKPSTRTE
ncbi:MAG: FAD-dependent oxidoreductase [Gammaproteobacteria bacterium]